jgi:radical SAM protein with 4Fe4S-binding SPASM domain
MDYVYDVNLFHRGEPLLNKNIIDMIEYSVTRGVKTRIHTNGVLLDKDLSRKLILSGLNLISFSFDGYSAKTYEKNRKGAEYARTIKNIVDFLEIKKELKIKTPFTIIQIMEFDDDLSPAEFKKQKSDFIKNFHDLPLDRVVIRNPHNWGGSLDMKDTGKKNRSRKRMIPCTFLWYSLTVFFDGKVYLCPQDFFGEIQVGDLNRESIKDIFNSEKVKNIRKRFKSRSISDLNPCKSCDRIWRDTFAGIPKEYFGPFLKDSLRKN